MKNKKIFGYMDKVDFDYQLEFDIDGVKIYPTINSLKSNKKCVEECGIVKVSITLEKVVRKTNYEKAATKNKPKKPAIKADKG